MAYSDSPAFDYDMNADFVTIQSCQRDERHNEQIQKSKDYTLLDDHLTFNLGDSFDSFEALKSRMEEHSKHSNVHYWLRDSRTVIGARMKTARHIEPRLKYYNIKYTCVYGGYKYTPRGKGKRNCGSMKLNCPAHVALCANSAGDRLDVVSVCNHHNHAIGPDIFRHLRQERRLPSQLKADVYDLLRMGVMKQRVIEYVRWHSGKTVTYKDVLNMAAAVKGCSWPSKQRREALIDELKKLESEHFESAVEGKSLEKIGSEKKKRRCNSSKKRTAREMKQSLVVKEEPSGEGTPQPADAFSLEQDSVEGRTDSYVDREVEIHYEEESHDSITHSNIMRYLYQTDCEEQPPTALNEETVTLQFNESSEQYLVSEDPCIDFERSSTFGELSEAQDIPIEDIGDIPVEDAHILSRNEIIIEETWLSNDGEIAANIDQQAIEDSAKEIENCKNCENIRLELHAEVNTLRTERKELTDETERLRRERDSLLREVEDLKGTVSVKKIPRIPVVVKPLDGRNKFYIVKI